MTKGEGKASRTEPASASKSDKSELAKKIKYILLGCGSIGYYIFGELNESDENILLVDKSKKRIEDLRDHRHQVMVGDITDEEFIRGLPEPEVAFVLTPIQETNLTAVSYLRKYFPSSNIIVRSIDTFSSDDLLDAGADVVLHPQTVFDKSAINHMMNLRTARTAQKLQNLLSSWSGTLGIITHKNPDPDAMAFLDNFKLSLFAHEVFVFTPNGDVIELQNEENQEIEERIGTPMPSSTFWRIA